MMPMKNFVNLFFYLSTLVCISVSPPCIAAPQTEEKPPSALEDSSTQVNAEQVTIESLVIDEPKEQDWNELKSFSKKYRWFGVYGEVYRGTTAESGNQNTIGILGLEYSHRYEIDQYWQASIAFTDIDGIFFRFHNKEIVRDAIWGRTAIRYGIQHTSNPNQQFGSFLNLNNFYANIGIGVQDMLNFPEEMRLQFDAYAGMKGLGLALSLVYDFPI